jgi:hypothetical protein
LVSEKYNILYEFNFLSLASTLAYNRLGYDAGNKRIDQAEHSIIIQPSIDTKVLAGVVSELFTAPKFLQTFNITTDNSAFVKGNIVAILQAGSAVGSLTSNILAGK